MPPRFLRLCIVVFWLGTTFWLIERDVWPRLRPGNPPVMAIDLADEATQNVSNRWLIFHQRPGQAEDERIGSATTSINYRVEDDTFDLVSQVKDLKLMSNNSIHVRVREMVSVFRVNREGQLREQRVEAQLELQLLGGTVTIPVEIRMSGQVESGQMRPTLVLEALGQKIEETLEAIDAPGGNVVTPLQAVHRLQGLEAGQRWQAPMVDPLGEAIQASIRSIVARHIPGGAGGLLQTMLNQAPTGPRTLTARVRDVPEILTWDNREEVCWVIDFLAEPLEARLWVRLRDGLVLRQEATFQGERIILQRQ